MKRIGIALSMLAAASLAMAADGASPARGKELFTGTQLGTSGKSCGTCHPAGKGLTQAAGYDEGELGAIINQCIMKPLKGKALDPASLEMRSLVRYIKSLAPSGRDQDNGSGH
jgi:cytochrome c